MFYDTIKRGYIRPLEASLPLVKLQILGSSDIEPVAVP